MPGGEGVAARPSGIRGRVRRRLAKLEEATRPVHRDLEAALARRWEELPQGVKTASQAIGRRTAGCEGTHGVFPRCDFACTPCYHGREANRVRTDGAHTVAEVDRQMAYLRAQRGPGQNAQLIGGEVTLLAPDDHAGALLAMRRHGRKPMSMSHGDFEYDYLRRLAVGPDGRPRFEHLSFAGHFDSMMFGRRGVGRPRREADLHPHRARFCEHFRRLERETGITHYLAHNMTVTPANLDQVAEVVRDCRAMGFRMFSFQPAAFMGNASRWRHDYREVTAEAVWGELERGAGARLPHDVFQIGDARCNRTAYGAYVGDRWIPFLDDRVPADLAVRDAFFATFGGMDFEAPRGVLAARVARALAARPGGLRHGVRWAGRFARRAGGLSALLRDRPVPVTYVVHSFMDADTVRPAWELLQRGELSEEPRVRQAQERLQACSYAMAHPDSDALVPACAQHGVLDSLENEVLGALLPR